MIKGHQTWLHGIGLTLNGVSMRVGESALHRNSGVQWCQYLLILFIISLPAATSQDLQLAWCQWWASQHWSVHMATWPARARAPEGQARAEQIHVAVVALCCYWDGSRAQKMLYLEPSYMYGTSTARV